MIRIGLALALLGLIGATALVLYQGAGPVLATFASAGWGLLWVALFHSVPMLANARAWQVLIPGAAQPSFGFFAWMVWVREAVNSMLPVARIGGEVAGAWLLIGRGVRRRSAVATLVVDMTMSLVSQFAFTLIGIGLLLNRSGERSFAGHLAFGLLVALPVLAAFGMVQRIGIFGEPSATRPWMLEFGGHHLALNVVIAGPGGTMTPTLTGAQPSVPKRR